MTGRSVPPVDDAITALRLQLLHNGYAPIPVVAADAPGQSPGKRPGLAGWQLLPLDPQTIRRWSVGPLRRCSNTGLRTGTLLGIDIDVLEPGLARELCALATRFLGSTPLRRIGQAPKSLLCYRAAEPSAKLATPVVHLPDGSKAQVEILGQGQQVVAYGRHPVTGSEYEWPESGPDAVPLAELPAVDQTQVRAFLAAAAAQMAEVAGQPHPPPGAEPARVDRQSSRKRQSPSPEVAHTSFFEQVNSRALTDIPRWFLQLFPQGYWQPNGSKPPGAWRVTSADLGRALEEDISVHETEGGHDFGIGQSKTPIDLVLEHGGASSAQEAALRLCDWLGVSPESLGWRNSGRQPASSGQNPPAAAPEPLADEPWPEPVDFLADEQATGMPVLHAKHLPEALYPFVRDTAARMGVDPFSVALSALVACSSVVSEQWCLQPKAKDFTWQEQPRLWGAIVGDPSIRKTPVIRACTQPIDQLDAAARQHHAAEMRDYRVDHARWKLDGSDPATEPRPPRLNRYLVESTTVEALTEILRDDSEARQSAPAGKVLVRSDEMSEFIANLDRYRQGGKGSGDRGAYLRLYNGGRHTIDRVGRGPLAASSWSACLLGGIQPGPIQRIARDTEDDGLLQRLLYCVPGLQAEGEDRPPDKAALQRYETLFPALAGLHPRSFGSDQQIRAVVLHADAHRHRLEITALGRGLEAMPDASPRWRAMMGKWPGFFARLLLTFHLIDLADARVRQADAPVQDVVSEDLARRVAALMRDVVLPHLLRAEALMFSTAQTAHARWIAGFLLAHDRTRVTARDIVQAYGSLRSPEARRDLSEVMESLVTVGWVRPEPQANPARPIAAWTVNPAVRTLFAERAARERQTRRQVQQQVAETIRQRQARRG